ncbi:30S ribosomal protein S9 [Desulfoluna spongiiphila]|uniref:Small ribosomal subunit protein uS9 n=1 Tax=Desulfoluna spongiiphila TaxID=419481 RepID=A0A1G5AZW2_9BACT|nr:30S ribosomal protein S9 [Desulfoluna spongiiphila]SCX83402.1 SSU ribosomal protein S9P [Desulfoluna spongiiphila]VVS92105.1 ribosomal protein s9 bacterial/plastid [Desulfoluna spongiiphila]
MEKENVFYATGKRKNGIARTWLTPGSGKITVNSKPVEEAFPNPMARLVLASPLALVEAQEAYDVNVKVKGGGIMGQAGAIRHGITKALLLADPELRDVLKRAGFITRDSRVKERKKYGQKGARARFQFSKR